MNKSQEKKDKFIAHGGFLKNLLVESKSLQSKLRNKLLTLSRINLNTRQLCDLELLMNGAFSPLEGFLDEKNYQSVVSEMRLKNKILWPIPIVLDLFEIKDYKVSSEVVLCDQYGNPLALFKISSIYKPDKEKEAKLVYGTTNPEHYGVWYLFNHVGNFYLGGKIQGIEKIKRYDFQEYRHTPRELQAWFEKENWQRIIGFQTRNPLHKVHYSIIKRAADEHQGKILIHPVVGPTKEGDVDYVTRVRSYIKLQKKYTSDFSKLSLLPLAMRMAGPREALWHMIIRKNYGCTHFIIGRDHAGPGKDRDGKSFYDKDEAFKLAKEYEEEIGIKTIPFEEMVYSEEEKRYVFLEQVKKKKNVNHISGSKIREMILNGKKVPQWLSFPEIIEELRKGMLRNQKDGLTIFFTGLPCAGKSTIAQILYFKLLEIQDKKITLLDGDIVRQNLSKGLGFSKEDRDENIKRIGFVAGEVTKHRGIAICAAVAPYKQAREKNRKLINEVGNYVEVYVSTPLEVCEKRDTKGLYKKARLGKIKGLTGIDDPYERPEKPEIILDTTELSPEECADRIVEYLKDKNLL